MQKRPNFNELCEEKARAGDKHASYILRRASDTGGVPLQIEIDYERKRLESYERAGIETYKVVTKTGEQTRTLGDLRAQIGRAEELGILDGSLSMSYEGAKRVYEKVRDIISKKNSSDRKGSSGKFLEILDAFDPARDSDLIATGAFVLDPQVRKYVDGRLEGLYKAVLSVGSHKRSGYTLPVHESRPSFAGGDVVSPRLKALLESIPEAKTTEEEENQKALKLLIHKRAERDVFPLFKHDVGSAFSQLEKLLGKEKNLHLRQEYESLRDVYQKYLEFEVPGVNPNFVDPTTGQKDVLPSLHQRIGIYGIVKSLDDNGRFGIWDGGGTGKTAQVILAQPLIERKLAERGHIFNRAVIVGPNPSKRAWKKGLIGSDTERYLAEPQNVFVINGEQKTDELLDRMGKAKWIVTNYEQLITRVNGDDRLLVDVLTDMGVDLVAFDEAQHIKGQRNMTRGGSTREPTLTQSAAARQLALQAKCFVPLSATPISNGLDDFAVLYHLINPEELKDPKKFQDKIKDSPRKLYTFFHEKSVRRTAEDINEELDWSEDICEVELDEVQRQIYDHIVTHRPGNWMTQARKALTDPRLVDPEILKNVGVLGQITHRNSAKYKALEELLKSDDGPIARGEKFVVFSMLMEGVTQKGNENLQRRYAEMGIAQEYDKLQLDLSIDSLLSQALKDEYQRDFKIGVIDGTVDASKERDKVVEGLAGELSGIVCTTKTGGESLDFTAANWMYFLDKDFKPDTEEQAIWRELRRGQKRKVNIWHLEALDTLEEKLDVYVEKKRLTAKIAMDGHPPTKEEWELLDDTEGKRLGDLIKRGLGGKSINVYDAPITEISDFEAKKRTGRGGKHYGTGVFDYTTTEAQEIMRLIGQKPQECWFDPNFVELYMKALPNLSTHVTNLARVADLVARAKRGEIEFPGNVLAEASGPSMLYRAYQELRPLIEKRRLAVPKVTDRDLSPIMLAEGTNPNKILGDMTGKDSTLQAESFDMVDNGSLALLRNPAEVYQSLLESHRILKPEGLLELTLKNKRFLDSGEDDKIIGFHAGLERLGFKVLTGKNEGFAISKNLTRRLKDMHGEHFAEAYAAKLANTYLLVAQKMDNPVHVHSDNFWFETIYPEAEEDKAHEQTLQGPSSLSSLKVRSKGAKIKREPRAKVTETNDFIHLADSSGNVHSVRKKQGEDKNE